MSVLPDGKVAKVEFCETHNETWNTNATAIVQAVRSTSVGPWAQFNVNFGTGGTTVTAGTPAKIAA